MRRRFLSSPTQNCAGNLFLARVKTLELPAALGISSCIPERTPLLPVLS